MSCQAVDQIAARVGDALNPNIRRINPDGSVDLFGPSRRSLLDDNPNMHAVESTLNGRSAAATGSTATGSNRSRPQNLADAENPSGPSPIESVLDNQSPVELVDLARFFSGDFWDFWTTQNIPALRNRLRVSARRNGWATVDLTDWFDDLVGNAANPGRLIENGRVSLRRLAEMRAEMVAFCIRLDPPSMELFGLALDGFGGRYAKSAAPMWYRDVFRRMFCWAVPTPRGESPIVYVTSLIYPVDWPVILRVPELVCAI